MFLLCVLSDAPISSYRSHANGKALNLVFWRSIAVLVGFLSFSSATYIPRGTKMRYEQGRERVKVRILSSRAGVLRSIWGGGNYLSANEDSRFCEIYNSTFNCDFYECGEASQSNVM